MTAAEFVALSTTPVKDINAWVTEASRDGSLSPGDLALLETALNIISRVTVKEAETKPDTAS
jgi:hypothetical protein